jgi:hypothetical protein
MADAETLVAYGAGVAKRLWTHWEELAPGRGDTGSPRLQGNPRSNPWFERRLRREGT